MRYTVDIEDKGTLTLADLAGVLEVTWSSRDNGALKFRLDERQLEELLTAINLIKAVRPKKSINVDTTHQPGMIRK